MVWAVALLLLGVASAADYKLVFHEDFQKLDTKVWEQEISAWGGGNWEFQVYTPEARNTYVRGGTLFIKPTLTSDRFGESFLRNGVLDLNQLYGKCTNGNNWGCRREGKYGFINPIMSGRIHTRQSWKYGRVEVLAKMPRGDWIWPAIWMMPKYSRYGGWPRSGEIDICESRGNRDYGHIGVQEMGSTLHWGLQNQNRYWLTAGTKKAKQKTFADGFHKHLLEWDKTGIRVYVDDELVLNAPTPSNGYYGKGNFYGQNNIWANGGKDAPFDQEFYIILNVAVGGTNGYFPDNVPNKPYPKPWKNSSSKGPEEFWRAKHQWFPTWKGEDAAMQVKYVKVWQKK